MGKSANVIMVEVNLQRLALVVQQYQSRWVESLLRAELVLEIWGTHKCVPGGGIVFESESSQEETDVRTSESSQEETDVRTKSKSGRVIRFRARNRPG